jgi:GH15 family glucan-1,4-alpha-glucosidase
VRFPIGDYGLIGDTRSAALVAPDGSIDWWCVPRFDDPPVFGRLVGGEHGGSFALGPSEATGAGQRSYRKDTVTLLTTWTVDDCELELADSLIGEVEGSFLPGSLLVRRLTARGRSIRVHLHLAPRFGYGRGQAARSKQCVGAFVCQHRDLALAVSSDGPCPELDGDVEFEVRPEAPVTIALTVTKRGPLIIVPSAVAADAASADEARWRAWASDIHVHDHREAAVRSLLTLQLLTYSPSGAPVAAPTASLPERLGGDRNWDYRYAWPRDASIGIAAFLAAGKPQEARTFLAWLLHASRLSRPRLPALFTIDGRPGPSEAVLEGWPGYAESRPVRIGNGAATQHQLDGYGWVIDAACQLTEAGHRLYRETWRAVSGFADQVAELWALPDAGIWEQRAEPAHHVHSKLMAWLALDRALRIAAVRGSHGRRQRRWAAARLALGEEVQSLGYSTEHRAYTATYGSSDLDAAVLVLPLVGIEGGSSARVTATVDTIRRELSAGGPLLYRYPPGTDGIQGGEGAFLPCSFWLVEALVAIGRRNEALALLEELLALAEPLGLFGEEMDPATGEHLGNYPQALTHASLVRAVLAVNTKDDP